MYSKQDISAVDFRLIVSLITSEKTQVSPYENSVDYNVFHKKESNCGDLYIPVKYHLNEILEKYNNFRNPLRQ